MRALELGSVSYRVAGRVNLDLGKAPWSSVKSGSVSRSWCLVGRDPNAVGVPVAFRSVSRGVLVVVSCRGRYPARVPVGMSAVFRSASRSCRVGVLVPVASWSVYRSWFGQCPGRFWVVFGSASLACLRRCPGHVGVGILVVSCRCMVVLTGTSNTAAKETLCDIPRTTESLFASKHGCRLPV